MKPWLLSSRGSVRYTCDDYLEFSKKKKDKELSITVP